MRIVFRTSTLILLALCASGICLACDCVSLPANESFEQADSVFEGEVIRIVEAGSENAFTFRMQKSLKGSDADEVVILEGGSDCDYQFTPGTTYRVYARRFGNRLVSGACSGNQVLKVSTTLPNSGSRNVSSSSTYQYLIAITGVAGLLCLLIWFLPRKGRHHAA
jgi:hypothetical protein